MAYNFKEFDAEFPDDADETYIGGKRAGLRGRGALGKTLVIGVVERRGEVRTTVAVTLTADSAISHIRKNVETMATVITDEFSFRYNRCFEGCDVLGEMFSRPALGHFSSIKKQRSQTG